MSTNDWCYQLLYIYIQQTEEKEARGQTDTKTSTPANGVLDKVRIGGKGYLWGSFLIAAAALKTPREMVITPKVSTSIFTSR